MLHDAGTFLDLFKNTSSYAHKIQDLFLCLVFLLKLYCYKWYLLTIVYLLFQILYPIWILNFFDIRYNVVEITFSKKVKYIIRISICFFKLFFIYLFIYLFIFFLLNKQRTTQINFANSCADHLCFCFSKC